eukprot:gene7727-8538_t
MKDDRVLPAIPVQIAVLKNQLRQGLSAGSRAFWWPVLPSCSPTSAVVSSDPDIPGCAERLAGILKEPLLDYKAMETIYQHESPSELLESTLRNLSYVLVNTSKTSSYGLVYFSSLLRIFVHVIKRVDIVCWMANTILDEPKRFGKYDYVGNFAAINTFKEMVKSYCPKTFSILHGMGALEDKYLNLIFANFFVEILPPSVVYSIIDAFLLEGDKVLYRYALAIIAAYKKFIKAGDFTSAKDFWITVKADSTSYAMDRSEALLAKVLNVEEFLPVVDPFILHEHCLHSTLHSQVSLSSWAFDRHRSAFQRAMRPMPISRQTIQKTLETQERSAPPPPPPGSAAVGGLSRRNSLSTGSAAQQRKSVSEAVLEEQSPGKGQSLSRKSSLRASLSRPSIGGALDESTPAIIPEKLNLLDSANLPRAAVEKVLAVLPELWRGSSATAWELVFSTQRHGWDLSSLYACLDGIKKPLLLLFHPIQQEREVTVGVTFQGPLRPAAGVVQGEGRSTLLFTAISPSRSPATESAAGEVAVTAYPWIGTKEPEDIENLRRMTESGEVSGEVLAALQHFCVATKSAILFGASIEHSCAALRIDAHNTGSITLGPSDTFNNPSLCSTWREGNGAIAEDGEQEKEQEEEEEEGIASIVKEVKIDTIEVFALMSPL